MKKFILEKEWIFLQRAFENVQQVSDKIEKTDSERDNLYEELCSLTGSDKNDSFYTVISKIHKNTNNEMTDIYRIVKHEACSIKVLNEGFNRFLQSRKNVINEIMEELIPDRKGTIYNRKGFSSHDGSSSSLIVNRHL
ncbi:MAG: hypothetical protein JEY91_11945 [Spirochaetaceae bacterium]|nr:hypothetical protein [Spirochaetaceae bacterium]